MAAIRNILELVLEFVSRPDYIAFYLGFVGSWCLWLAFRGLRLQDTKAFGFRAPDVSGAAAILKLHHAVSDGVGLVRMTSSLVERSPDHRDDAEEPEPTPPVPEPWSPVDETLDALRRLLL